MAATRHIKRPPARGRLSNNAGLTLIEVLIVAGISIAVVMAAAVAYQGTVFSWRGTTALLGIQRDAALAAGMIENNVRPASEIIISADGDSMEIYYPDSGGSDSLAAVYYADANGNLRDINGTVLATGVDSLHFQELAGAVNLDIILKDDIGTTERTTDDQAIYMSTSAVIRN